MKSVAVIGGGPAGLMAAETIARSGAKVTVYDHKPSVARKLLIAGRGGLNLTHSEDADRFLSRYGSAEKYLRGPIGEFPREKLVEWAESLGQETFTGSSGRVFPRAMKASPLLRAWLARLAELGVTFRLSHSWRGWEANGLRFRTPDGDMPVEADAAVLALGGASWTKLGSDGGWVKLLEQEGIQVAPLKPANCGFTVNWTQHFIGRFAGQPLKPVEIAFGGEKLRGEIMITKTGVEGGAIYAMSAAFREEIETKGEAIIHLDLRPDVAPGQISGKLKSSGQKKLSFGTMFRRNSGLADCAIGLLNEITMQRGRKLADLETNKIAALMKRVPLKLSGIASIDRAISSAGGVRFDQIDGNFMLKKKPGVFVAGEMLDWEAPTGGYLLHACFATGMAAGRGALEWLGR